MSTKKKARTLTATLVRGQSYLLRSADGSKLFQNGKPIRVTEAERAHLAEHAVDHVTLPARTDAEDYETREYQKFSFEETDHEPTAN
jgi:hypothetical protein